MEKHKIEKHKILKRNVISRSKIRKELYEKFQGKCGYCGKEIDIIDSQLDMFYPYQDGGAEDESNYVLSCKECNHRKGGFSPIDKDGKELIFNPINDKLSRHIELNSDSGVYNPLTEKGKKAIDVFSLNRDSEIRYRLNNRETSANIYIDKSEVNDYLNYSDGHYCSVTGCSKVAQYAVFLYDKYNDGEIFLQQDFTCKYICEEHHFENEKSYTGIRVPRVSSSYKYTNKNSAQGYTRYLNIQEEYNLKIISEKCDIDYLGINKDVESFANLIMNKDLELPMNIGIFGGWGTGKSFFINALKEELTANYEKSECLTIEFNAWNYYDSNITINLVYNIFDEINKRINNESNSYLKQLIHYKQLREDEILQKRKEIEEKICELNKEKENFNTKFVINLVKKSGICKNDIEEILSKYSDVQLNLNEIAKDIKSIPSCLNLFKQLAKNKISIIAIIFIIVAIIVKSIPNDIRILSGIISSVTIAINAIPKVNEFIKNVKNKELYINIKNEIIESSNRLNSINKEIEALKNIGEDLIDKAEQENISIEYLKGFMSERLNSPFYKDNLSFISIVKQDIDNLNTLRENIEELKKLRKIVLIIDDLDRCPQDKVVEVLQTIQLLLSTNMFIVIIAVDSKWINNCIISEYDKLLTNNEHYANKNLFAINYLEKIIHIPFWMDSLNDKDSLSFIETVFKNKNLKTDPKDEVACDIEKYKFSIGGTDSEKSESNIDDIMDDKRAIDIEEYIEDNIRNITLSDNDIANIKEMYFIFKNISPRKIKRFLNTALIIKYKYFNEGTTIYKQILFGAATIILKPSISNELYKHLFKEYIDDNNKTVIECINLYLKNISSTNQAKDYIIQVRDYICKNWSDLKLIEFEEIIYKSSRYTYYHGEIFKLD